MQVIAIVIDSAAVCKAAGGIGGMVEAEVDHITRTCHYSSSARKKRPIRPTRPTQQVLVRSMRRLICPSGLFDIKIRQLGNRLKPNFGRHFGQPGQHACRRTTLHMMSTETTLSTLPTPFTCNGMFFWLYPCAVKQYWCLQFRTTTTLCCLCMPYHHLTFAHRVSGKPCDT